MKFKAVIFDMDGTLLPIGSMDGPSIKVVETIMEAHKYAKVSVATGRDKPLSMDILRSLDIKDPVVLSGGSEIVDPLTGHVMWKRDLNEQQIKKVVEIYLKHRRQGMSLCYGGRDMFTSHFDPLPHNVNEIAVIMTGVPEHLVDEIRNEINEIDGIVTHTPFGNAPGTYNIDVNHKEGDKEHGIRELLNKLGLKKEEVIGVGDSPNDIPMFASVGFKVAMGDAHETLKSLADYIAPTVHEDGAAHVLEKFIIKR